MQISKLIALSPVLLPQNRIRRVMDGAHRDLTSRSAAHVARADQRPHRLLDFGLAVHFHDHNRLLRADLDAFAAMGTALLPDAVGSEAALIRLLLLALDRIVLAGLPALVAHGAERRVDLVPHKLPALMIGADPLYL